MDRQLFVTEDGSSSIRIPELGENYHSSHGAITESSHIYIDKGLNYCKLDKIRIFEMGFGTGLNAYLSFMYAQANQKTLEYFCIEKYPLSEKELLKLNYPQQLKQPPDNFHLLHSVSWDEAHAISSFFTFHKIKDDIRSSTIQGSLDVIYYDAFGPDVQPELWTIEVFNKLYKQMNPGGTLVTYSAKGQVRRDLISCGFSVERIPGPPGKRQMIRAIKPL